MKLYDRIWKFTYISEQCIMRVIQMLRNHPSDYYLYTSKEKLETNEHVKPQRPRNL